MPGSCRVGRDPPCLQFGGDLEIDLGTQHESAEEGAHPFKQVRGQQSVDRAVDLPQAQHRDDAALRRVVAGELGPAVAEQRHVAGELSLQESGGVSPANPQHTEAGERDSVDRLGWLVHGRSARILRHRFAFTFKVVNVCRIWQTAGSNP